MVNTIGTTQTVAYRKITIPTDPTKKDMILGWPLDGDKYDLIQKKIFKLFMGAYC